MEPKLNHIFVFMQNAAASDVLDQDGNEIAEEIHVIDYDQESLCPVCSEELEGVLCPECGLDTSDVGTNADAIKAFFRIHPEGENG